MALRGLVGTAMLLVLLGLVPMFGWLNWYVLLICLIGFGQMAGGTTAPPAYGATAQSGQLFASNKLWKRMLRIVFWVAVVRLILGGGFY